MTRRTLSEVRDVRVAAPSVTMTVGGGLDLREEGSVLFLFLHQDGSLTSMHRCMCMCMCGCVCVCGGRGKGDGCLLYMCVFVMVACVCVCV